MNDFLGQILPTEFLRNFSSLISATSVYLKRLLKLCKRFRLLVIVSSKIILQTETQKRMKNSIRVNRALFPPPLRSLRDEFSIFE